MHRLTILVVDDEYDNRLLITHFLKRTTAKLITAESVYGAKQVLHDTHIDLVVCDYLMTDGNGLDVLSYMHSEHLNLPFIICSSMERSEIPMRDEFDFKYVSKTDMKALLSEVQTCLSEILH